MREQSDEFILDAYKKAVKLKLEPEFLHLLEEELERRSLKIHTTTVR
ncbi:sporulation histidine kinase inhibitor Sda [Domibacillus indicus]|nr:sporulation histidine kinase inhibitor Sda [Domibacillus indicus]